MKILKPFLLLLCLLLPSAFASAAEAGKPLAVLIHADWCYNCKMITPRLTRLKAIYEDRVRFEKLDVTDKAQKKQAKATAKSLGILPLYIANKGTGLVLLINPAKQKVGELRYTMSDEEMTAALDKLITGG